MRRHSLEALLIPLLFVIGVVSTIVYLGVRPPMIGGGENVAIAQTLVRTGTYGNPFLILPTGPTAVIVPGYPLFLALNMKLFGGEYYKAVGIIAFALHGLHAVLVLFCARRIFGRPGPGIWAAVLSTVLPVFRLIPAADCMMTADGLMLFYLLLSAGEDLGRRPFRTVSLGALAGGLLLLNASAFLVIAPLIGVHCARNRGWAAARTSAAIVAIAGLCLTPWLLRNQRVLGAAVVKNNFGFTAYASNNDCAQPGLDQMFDCYARYHPAGNLAEAQLIVQKGEAAYDRYRLGSTAEWVRAHPRRFAALTGLRILAFWLPLPSGGLFHWSLWPVTILSALGLWWLFRLRHPVVFEMAVVFLIYPLMYYVVVADTRYRYPIVWLSLLAAGFACERLWAVVFGSHRDAGAARELPPVELGAAAKY